MGGVSSTVTGTWTSCPAVVLDGLKSIMNAWVIPAL
jgi:hypothetical protein